MKRLIIITVIIFLIIAVFMNYPDIATFIIAGIQHKEDVTVFYDVDSEPSERIADISIVALDSMIATKIGDKQYRFVSLDVNEMGDFSDGETQYLMTYFKKYSEKVIHASLKDLEKIGLRNPLTKDLHGGVLLSIDDVVEISNERVVLKISYHESGLGGAGYICTLIYKNGKWEVDELEMKYVA